MTTVINYY